VSPSEPHTEIGTILQRSVEMVIERWSRRAVEEQPNAKRVHHEVLLDHLRPPRGVRAKVDHALTVDVADLQSGGFRAPQPGTVDGHE
jgi:hypothetical protein